MSRVYMFLADGLEEVECLGAADVLRRASIETVLVSVTGSETVTGSHGIRIRTDMLFEDVQKEPGDVMYLPGGMPGTLNLKGHKGLTAMLVDSFRNGERIAAICAAPSILGALGMLSGRRAVCYPGYEEELEGAILADGPVAVDGPFVTACGLGAVFDMGLELVRLMKGQEESDRIAKAILYRN